MVVKYLRWKGVKIHQTFIDTWPSCLKIRSRQREGRRILVSGYKSNHPRSKGNCQCENPFPFPPTPISCHVCVVNNGCVFNESPAATRGPFNAPCISAWIHKCPPPPPPPLSLCIIYLEIDSFPVLIGVRTSGHARTRAHRTFDLRRCRWVTRIVENRNSINTGGESTIRGIILSTRREG